MNSKHFYFIVTLFFTMLINSVYGQSEISTAIKTGNLDQLAAYFDNNVDMKILDKENIFSQAQAKLLLKEFFSENQPQDFSISHQGGPESAKFAIGNLKTTKGNFRVYFLFKQKGNLLLIQKFRIEND